MKHTENKNVIEALGEWVLRVAKLGYAASPEEILALPSVAALVLTYGSPSDLEVK